MSDFRPPDLHLPIETTLRHEFTEKVVDKLTPTCSDDPAVNLRISHCENSSMTHLSEHRPLPLGLFPENPTPRLYDRIIEVLRVHHDSIRTERAYVGWMRRFILFHRPRHPREFSAADVNRFLTHLAVEKHVAASTQNQALAAVLFLDEKVLDEPLNRIEDVVRAKRPQRLPVVLTRDEARRILNELEGVHRTVGLLLYGSGLRLLEALRLRVKDVDFVRREFTVRQGKGDKDRRTMLPATLAATLFLSTLNFFHDIRTVQELLGHSDVRTTMIDTHVLNRGGHGVRSPADFDDFVSE